MTSLLTPSLSHGSPPHRTKDLPSLLIPSNPALVDSSPKGGILINKRRPSIVDPVEIPVAEAQGSGSHDSLNADPSPTQRIRFAPLPDPRRPRSLSTGENVEINSTYDDDGNRTAEYARKDADVNQHYGDSAIDDEDEDEDESDKKGWKAMSMGGWKGTKKLLKPLRSPSVTGVLGLERDEGGGLSFGVPLKKSVSTSGVTSSGESERKRTFLSSPPATGSQLAARRTSYTPSSPLTVPTASHRRNSSLESTLGSSPRPVKMLNGRVYGQRRASDLSSQPSEPVFNEWGGKDGGVMGSRNRKDDDDGSGMEWVKKRREERERRKSEAALAEPIKSESESSPPLPVTPLSPPPTIQVSGAELKDGLYEVESRPEEKIQSHEGEKHQHEVRQIALGEQYGKSDDEEDDDEEEQGDEDDEDDDEDDDELEDGLEAKRSTCSAAGVEVVSRHK